LLHTRYNSRNCILTTINATKLFNGLIFPIASFLHTGTNSSFDVGTEAVHSQKD
jgi:hypothetical protein